MKVIDNKVSKTLQNKIEEYFLHDNFPWYYNDNSLGKHVPKKYKTITKDSFNEFQLTHKFVDKGKINSPHTNIVMNLLSELDMEGTPILRCKANLKFRTKANDGEWKQFVSKLIVKTKSPLYGINCNHRFLWHSLAKYLSKYTSFCNRNNI